MGFRAAQSLSAIGIAALLLSPGPHPSQAGQAPRVALPALDVLGLRHTLREGRSGARIATVEDLTHPQRIELTFSPLGKLLSEQVMTPGGRLLERREIRPGLEIRERFAPPHVRTEISRDPSGFDRVTRQEFIQGALRSITQLIHPADSASSGTQCEPLSRAPVDASLLQDLGWLRFAPGAVGPSAFSDTESVQLGQAPVQLVADNCGAYPGGYDGLARDFQESLTSGLSCLAGLGSEARRDASRIVALLQNPDSPAVIRCGHSGQQVGTDHHGKPLVISDTAVAMAYMPGNAGFPGLQLNLDAGELQEDPQNRRATLFHEMVHWTGHRHGVEKEVPYLAEFCCARQDKDACDLLRSDADWQSAGTQARFMTIMMRHYQSSVAYRSAWNISLSKLRANPPAPDGASALLAAAIAAEKLDQDFEFEAVPQIHRTYGFALEAQVLSRAAMGRRNLLRGNEPVSALAATLRRDYYPPGLPELAPQRSAIEAMGSLMGALLRGDGRAFAQQWPSGIATLRQSCEKLNPNERGALNRVWRLAYLSVFTIEPKAPSEATLTHEICPESSAPKN